MEHYIMYDVNTDNHAKNSTDVHITIGYNSSDDSLEALNSTDKIILHQNDPDSPPFMHSQNALNILVTGLNLYYCPILSICGIFGDIICIIVFFRKSLYKLSYSQYLLGLLFSEIIYLLVLFHRWLSDYRGLTDPYRLDGWCQFITMIQNASTFLIKTNILALTLDRFILVCFPIQGTDWCTALKAKVVVSVISILSLVIYLNLSMIHGEIFIHTRTYCVPLPNYQMMNTYLQAANTVFSFIVMCSILVLVSATVGQIIKDKRKINQHPVRVTARCASAMLRTSAENEHDPSNQQVFFCVYITVCLFCHVPAQCVFLYITVSNLTQFVSDRNLLVLNMLLEQVMLYWQHSRILLNLPIFGAGFTKFRCVIKEVWDEAVSCKQQHQKKMYKERKRTEKYRLGDEHSKNNGYTSITSVTTSSIGLQGSSRV